MSDISLTPGWPSHHGVHVSMVLRIHLLWVDRDLHWVHFLGHGHRWARNGLHLLPPGYWLLRGTGLPLAAHWLAGSIVRGTLLLWLLLVVEEVVTPWEAVAWDAPLAAGIEAKMGSLSMSVHTVCLSFVPQQACRG